MDLNAKIIDAQRNSPAEWASLFPNPARRPQIIPVPGGSLYSSPSSAQGFKPKPPSYDLTDWPLPPQVQGALSKGKPPRQSAGRGSGEFQPEKETPFNPKGNEGGHFPAPPPGLYQRQATDRTHRIPSADRKLDGGVSIALSSPDPQPPAPNGVCQGRRSPPPPLPPPPPPPPPALIKGPTATQSREPYAISPVDRNPGEGVSIDINSMHPQPPPAPDSTPRRQSPTSPNKQGTCQGYSGNPPPVERKSDFEGIPPTNPAPQPPAQDRNKRGGAMRGGRSRAQGGIRSRTRDFTPEIHHDNEGGASIDTDLPDPQSPAQDIAPHENRQNSVSKGRAAARGRGQSGNARGRAGRGLEGEVVSHDSSEHIRSKESKLKMDPSGSRDGVDTRRTPTPAPKRPNEPTQDYAKLLIEFTKLSKESEQTTAQLQARLIELDEVLAEKDSQILGLTEVVARLHQRDVEITKDDNYFATQFSDIASIIEQWVITNFPRNTMIYNVDNLPSPLRQFIHMSITPEDRQLFQFRSTRMRVISAVVAEMLYRHVFYYGPYHLLGSPEATDSLQVLSELLQGNVFQCQRWRALTIGLTAKGDKFETGFAQHVSVVTDTIDNLLSYLIPGDPDRVRPASGLRELVDRAARLSVEIRKQSDNIYLDPIVPGSPFISEHMEDMSCLLEDNELVGATVQIQIFPAVLRHSCESDGNLSKQAGVVMKARVIAVNHLFD